VIETQARSVIVAFISPNRKSPTRSITMKITRTRTAIATVALGAIALTGTFATGIAGAQSSSGSGQSVKHFASTLTADQKSCLSNNGVVRPGRKATLAERQAFLTTVESAAGTCGITLPAKLERRIDWITSIDQAQLDCMKANVTRPTDHTPAARAKFKTDLRAAAKTCGITKPAA
jgi:hypothetical protein